jgi:hypothetical protein
MIPSRRGESYFHWSVLFTCKVLGASLKAPVFKPLISYMWKLLPHLLKMKVTLGVKEWDENFET